MRKLKRFLKVFLFCFLGLCLMILVLYATGFIQVYHLTSGYRYLSAEQQSKVYFAGDRIGNLDRLQDSIHRSGGILCVNGAALRKALLQQEKSLVYVFSEGCSSPSCLPLSTIGRYAKEIGAKPYYVAVDLEPDLFLHPEPILSIDYRSYGTKWYPAFYPKFMEDLVGRYDEEDSFNLLLFEHGKLVRTFSTKELLPPSSARND